MNKALLGGLLGLALVASSGWAQISAIQQRMMVDVRLPAPAGAPAGAAYSDFDAGSYQCAQLPASAPTGQVAFRCIKWMVTANQLSECKIVAGAVGPAVYAAQFNSGSSVPLNQTQLADCNRASSGQVNASLVKLAPLTAALVTPAPTGVMAAPAPARSVAPAPVARPASPALATAAAAPAPAAAPAGSPHVTVKNGELLDLETGRTSEDDGAAFDLEIYSFGGHLRWKSRGATAMSGNALAERPANKRQCADNLASGKGSDVLTRAPENYPFQCFVTREGAQGYIEALSDSDKAKAAEIAIFFFP